MLRTDLVAERSQLWPKAQKRSKTVGKLAASAVAEMAARTWTTICLIFKYTLTWSSDLFIIEVYSGRCMSGTLFRMASWIPMPRLFRASSPPLGTEGQIFGFKWDFSLYTGLRCHPSARDRW
jgi:hypothetical protein